MTNTSNFTDRCLHPFNYVREGQPPNVTTTRVDGVVNSIMISFTQAAPQHARPSQISDGGARPRAFACIALAPHATPPQAKLRARPLSPRPLAPQFNPRACLTDDDYQALVTLYPMCQSVPLASP